MVLRKLAIALAATTLGAGCYIPIARCDDDVRFSESVRVTVWQEGTRPDGHLVVPDGRGYATCESLCAAEFADVTVLGCDEPTRTANYVTCHLEATECSLVEVIKKPSFKM